MSFLVPALYTLIIMLDTCVSLQVVFLVGREGGGGGGGWRQGQTILLRKNNDEGVVGRLAWENAVLIKTIHLIATFKKWGVTVSLK